MKARWVQLRQRGNRRGSAGAALLAVIVLVLLVISAKYYLKKTAKDPDICHDLTPWKEWQLREAREKVMLPLGEAWPEIKDGLNFTANPGLKDEPRGEMMISLSPQGVVRGLWHGQYYKKPNINFDILNGSFEGYVCPGKIYSDENGEDPSKLYFITNGKFLIAETDFQKNTLFHRGGNIYVTGWLSKDYSLSGNVTITSDEKYFEVFEFKTFRPKNNINLKLN